MTPEAKVKAQIKQALESVQGCYFFMPPANGYGRAGIPDFVGCLNGLFFAIEAKAGKGTTTALQDREIEKIKNCGGFAIVVNENNVSRLATELEAWGREQWIP